MWSDENNDELVICATQIEKAISVEAYSDRLYAEKFESSVPETQHKVCERKETTQETFSENPELSKKKDNVSNKTETTQENLELSFCTKTKEHTKSRRTTLEKLKSSVAKQK